MTNLWFAILLLLQSAFGCRTFHNTLMIRSPVSIKKIVQDNEDDLEKSEIHQRSSNSIRDCTKPPMEGESQCHNEEQMRFYYDHTVKTCNVFTFTGCGGNRNNFKTREECFKVCGNCFEDSEPGPCRGRFNRHYFNIQSNKCESFTYGGCGGNGNNYQSLRICQNNCGEPAEPKPKRIMSWKDFMNKGIAREDKEVEIQRSSSSKRVDPTSSEPVQTPEASAGTTNRVPEVQETTSGVNKDNNITKPTTDEEAESNTPKAERIQEDKLDYNNPGDELEPDYYEEY